MSRENTAWHVAGHAYMASGFAFSIELLSLDGFPVGKPDGFPRVQRLDKWTMIRLPGATQPGTVTHSLMMDNLCRAALAGPASELRYRGIPSSLQSVQQFEDDWHQAWTAAGVVRPDEAERISWLTDEIGRMELCLSWDESRSMIHSIAQKLLKSSVVTGEEVIAIREEYNAKREREALRSSRRGRPVRMLDDNGLPVEE